MNQKTLKLLQIFETLVPKRSAELRDKEYSETILKEIKQRKELEEAGKKQIEEGVD